MSKGPTPRHSKSPKPVTIDLDATDVTPKAEPTKAKSSVTGPAVARTPDPVEPDKTAGKTPDAGAAAAASSPARSRGSPPHRRAGLHGQASSRWPRCSQAGW